MQDASPSRTALATAFVRALHVRIDDPPPVLDDTVAFDLLPSYQRRFITRLEALSSPTQRRYRQKHGMFTAMRAHIVVRARYAEDALVQARKAGAGRYVVLAAGLDTFALRQVAPAIDVVEIDHPATQRWKRELLTGCGLAERDAVTWLPVDFERQSLAEAWVSHAGPDFISWLGVTYYLTRDAIAGTLRALAENTGTGSGLVLDYWREAPPIDASTALFWSTRLVVTLLNERMVSFFEPAEIEGLAVAAGWRVREHCLPEAQDRRYLAARADHLAVPSFACLLYLER